MDSQQIEIYHYLNTLKRKKCQVQLDQNQQKKMYAMLTIIEKEHAISDKESFKEIVYGEWPKYEQGSLLKDPC